MTDSENKKLDEMHDDIRSIKQCLKGYNGNPGLLKEFEEHKTLGEKRWQSYMEFKTKAMVLITLCSASGGGLIGSAVTRIAGG